LTEHHIAPERLIIWISIAAVVAVSVIRYLQAPSFWLDEAFVAVSLRDPSPASIFAPLRYDQYFPRVYLGAIAVLRELLGYQIWVLRLLPSLCFITATILWARLLAKRSGGLWLPAALSGAFLLGGSFWLEQSIQLKQYTLDVLVSLIPFAIGDEFFTETLTRGKRKSRLILLAIPCLISYVYPIALGARAIGWYALRARQREWRLAAPGVFFLIVSVAIGLVSIWVTDYRFYLRGERYLAYWNASILSAQFKEGIGSGLGLIANFIWGWHHGRLMPLMIAAVAPLQALGVYSVVGRWKNRDTESSDIWGSRSLGSLVLLAAVILASAIANYPISAGRLVLFAQVHTQILAVEGALFLLTVWARRKAALIFLCGAIAIVTVYSVHRYVDNIRTEPRENIRPMLPLLKAEIANTAWVNPCSVAQVESLPDRLPVERVVLQTRRQQPPPGEKTWILWTNMSDDYCRDWLDACRSRALRWQVIHEGPGRGLALAEF
jgi:hypothetical protein